MPTDANRRQQTPTNRHQQTPQDSDRCCLSMSGRVPWYLLSPVGMSCSLKMSGDVWGVFGGYLSSIHGNLSPSDVIGGYRDSQSLQYGAKALLRHSPERHNFCHLTLLRHWNIKMVAYKLSKNGWVMLFLWFLGLPEKNYLWQLLWITLYQVAPLALFAKLATRLRYLHCHIALDCHIDIIS